jgi:hypothetical protein
VRRQVSLSVVKVAKCIVPLRKEWFSKDAAVIDDTEDFSSSNIVRW